MPERTIQITTKLKREVGLKLKKMAKDERRTIKAILEMLIEDRTTEQGD